MLFRTAQREEKDVADGRAVGQEHDQAVNANAQAACRRQAVFQSAAVVFIHLMRFVIAAFPVVGVPLPFISYGGSSLIFTMLAIGILINVGRIGERDAILREQQEYEEELQATAPRPHIGLRLVKTDRKKPEEKSGPRRRRRR